MGNFIMSKKEREQIYIFNKLANKEISQVAAAQALNFSTRWVREKFKRFKQESDRGLVHKNRGRQSNKKWKKDHETTAIKLLQNEFKGFGPTFAAEKLLTLYGIKVSSETLRKAMIRNKIWFAKNYHPKHRVRRERSTCLGLMVQLDGSPHAWFEDRGSSCTLLVFIDDATSKLLWLEFANSEAYESVLPATHKYILKYGIPASFYVDYGGVFSVNNNNEERDKKTQFERACNELGIRVIHASSPQAKGRVERSNKTLQDRLVKEMRLRGISTIEAANQFAQKEFLEHHNMKFAIQAKEPQNAHKAAVGYNLNNIFCLKEKRIVQNDFTLTYNKQIFQLSKQQLAVVRPKDEVQIYEHFDGTITLWLRKIKLNFTKINMRPTKTIQEEQQSQIIHIYKSRSNHPWRKYPACTNYQNP